MLCRKYVYPPCQFHGDFRAMRQCFQQSNPFFGDIRFIRYQQRRAYRARYVIAVRMDVYRLNDHILIRSATNDPTRPRSPVPARSFCAHDSIFRLYCQYRAITPRSCPVRRFRSHTPVASVCVLQMRRQTLYAPCRGTPKTDIPYSIDLS